MTVTSKTGSPRTTTHVTTKTETAGLVAATRSSVGTGPDEPSADTTKTTRALAVAPVAAAAAATPTLRVASLPAPASIMRSGTDLVTAVLSSLATPLTNTPGSPAEWMLAAAARREVGDTDTATGQLATQPVAASGPVPLGPVGTRVVLALNTLLQPVQALVADLTGRSAEEEFPGSCVDSKCVSSTDIPVPQPSIQLTFINLTGRPLTLTNLSTYDPLAFGPQNGYVLDTARQVEMGFYTNNDDDTSSRATMDWTDGTSSFDVYVRFDSAFVTPSSSDVQSDVFNTPNPVTGDPQAAVSQTVLFLPKAGTEITISPTDGVGQAIVATALCGNRGSCTQDAVDETIVYSAAKNVGNTVFNYGTVDSSNTYEVFHEAVKTNGIEQNLKIAAGGSIKFSLGPLNFESEVSAVIQEKYGHSWTDGVITKQGATVNVAPGMYGQIQLSYGEYHDIVDMTLTDKDVTIKIPDIEYVSPVPADAKNEDGTPVAAPIWTTVDYAIGTGPDPYPNSTSVPTAPTNTSAPVSNPTPADIAAPEADPAPARKTFGAAIRDFVKSETRAILSLPQVLLTGHPDQLSTRGFEIVNLTPYPQKLIAIGGEIEEDESPTEGYVLQPFQMVRIEVDYAAYGAQEAVVKWQRNDGGTATISEAILKNFPDGGSAVKCQTSACMDGGEDEVNSAEVMYIIQPTLSTFDLTADPNLAAAAVDAACYYNSAGQTPGSCGVNVIGQSYYTAPVTAPSRYNYNNASQENSFSETLTTYKSETNSWSTGGGIKVKEKAGVFLGLQIEAEATVLYTGSVQEKDSESTTVKQNVPPYSTGTLSYGDTYLRTYGDAIICLPNSTMIVRDQWIENPSGLAATGPVVSLTDYPGPPQV
ncbi:hypothetical protein ORI20_20225 [Mycobacterium sp. CVI_P3]|uniref:Uncharacterized protein n=1 Tax=Mycobacterium pinniadriaticum TaxID=2994102 RepID=A0ABT3SHW0_9MYCO|nr:hypothetical protein [Mycobacterium pinniadriaticum]MCX2932604.1 hypothetical protein [Mycobacterium pinniadriaticum]MCX2938952.1 hypothetical protein [Mycobacterium pinniadriaticum]